MHHSVLCLIHLVSVDYLSRSLSLLLNFNSVLIKFQLECTAGVSQSLCEAFSVRLLPRRSASLYEYTTRKKRRIQRSEDPENLNWAQSLLEMKKDNDASKTTDQEPHMLHVVYLIKTLKGRPWWEKDMIKKLGFEFDTTKKHVSVRVTV